MNTEKIVIVSILILGMINWSLVSRIQSESIIVHSSHHNYQSTNGKTVNSDLPINITSNNQFEILGFPGTGTQDDPYRIEHLNINTSNGVLINIENSSVHFKISNCLINGFANSNTGISLTNVKYALIENTTISTIKGDGITATNISECSFRNNQLDTNNRFGILLLESSNCSIEHNIIYNNQINGVHIKDCQKIIVSDNAIYNHQYGEYSRSSLFLENSSEIKIELNSLNDNYNGISLINSADENLIKSNMIFNNLKYGIRLEYASRNTIENNTFSGNLDYGIEVTIGSNDNIMQLNNFTGNNEGGRQASDDGINNEFIGNYWTDWNNTDTDKDLIADIPYPIDGISTNSDPFPLVNLSKEAREVIERKQESPSVALGLFLLLMLLGGGIAIGYGTYTYREYRKKKLRKNLENDTEEPFREYLSVDLLKRLKPLYHKLIVGLEYIQTYFFPQSVTVPL
ncbi:MAG: right-handed parallel beta-helix repeat-containing protein, partial [Candidatus Hodarchaeales archaeon]